MNKLMTGAILVFYLLIGCAAPQITPIRRGEPISVVFTRSPKADGVIDIRNDDLAGDAKVGAGTGATGGAVAGAIAGLTCGPFFIFCAPVFAAAGAVVGTATGAGVGAGVAIAGELSNEKAAQLRDRVGRVQQSHSLPAELQKNVNDRAQKYWKLGTDQSAALVTIELQDLLLSSMRNEQINCTIRVSVSVQRGVAKDSKTTEQKIYQYAAPTSSLSIWLDESNDFIDTVLTSASQQISTQIVSDLAMTGIWAEVKASEKNEEKANLLATPPAAPPAGTPVASRLNAPAFNPVEPWTGNQRIEFKSAGVNVVPSGPWAGKWNVQGASSVSGLWVLKQEGETVISTDESYYRVRGKAAGDKFDGDVIRLAGTSRDIKLNLVLSLEGKSFVGYIEEATGKKRISGIKFE